MLLKSVLTMPRLMPASPGNSSPSGAVGSTVDLLPGHERQLAIVGIGERRLHVVTEAEIQGDPRMDAEIVLREPLK